MQHQSSVEPVKASSDRTLWMLRWAQGLAVLGAVLIAALIVTEHRQHCQEVAHQAYEQNLLKMGAVQDHGRLAAECCGGLF